ncbi:acyltransferase family protein [Luteimonas sp. SJ-92]|uniref:Acyltransferase family protein n=1 Tax=Luteimonas salinisoli TaxID=2752307 RepID=A0A853JEL0_9GAMM|nr:acyltransferase family protein [Luteimonas salinisoli]NZA27771.1 acyltransferase family protein [Luteimonas salinisoli]
MSANPVPARPRRHDIDALRVLAFAVLILYHAGMFYVADWGWHIKSTYLADWLKWPMILVNQWRMSLLFLISGVAVNFLLRRSGPGAFAWSRTRRLLVPLLFGMAVVVPPQAYLQALSNGSFDGDYAQFLLRYVTFQPWPAGAFDGSHVGVTWNHLWYLPYLLAYSLLLAALLPLLRGRGGQALRDRFRGLRGWRLWLLPALPLAVASWLLIGRFPTTHDLIADWHSHAIYFAMFLYGYWIGADTGLWEELKRRRWWLLGAAIPSFVAILWLLFTTGPESSTPMHALFALVQRLNAWTWILAVLAWGHHLLNRPFRWLPYASQAVYPWYVLHQTITVVAGYWLAKLALGPVVEPALVVLVTVAGCLVIYEFAIRRVRALRPLFGVPPAGRTPPPDVARGACASAS